MTLPPWAIALIQTALAYFESLFGAAATTNPPANPTTQEEHLKAAQYHLHKALHG